MPRDRAEIGQPRFDTRSAEQREAEIKALHTRARVRDRAREKLNFCKDYVLQQGDQHTTTAGAATGALLAWDRLMEDPEIKELIG